MSQSCGSNVQATCRILVFICDILWSDERTARMERMGDRLKWCRRRYGWTQRDLASITRVGLTTIRRIEQHDFEPRLDTVRRLAETLRVRTGWLAFGEEPMLDRSHLTAERKTTRQSKSSESETVDDGFFDPWHWD